MHIDRDGCPDNRKGSGHRLEGRAGGAAIGRQLAKDKNVARARRQASKATKKAADRVTGRAQKRTRAKMAAAVVGAVATAAAVGVGIARKRKR